LEAADPKGDQSSPDMGSLDSSWGDDDDLDEDATRVAKIPHDLVALSRRGSALEKDVAPPEKHEAITARPPPVEAPRQGPPIETAVASVVVDAPHEQLPPLASASVAAADEDDEDEEDDDEPNADELDAGWDVEEEKAAAADVAAGLDAEARRKAAEQRAVARKEKGRAKVLAAKEKRKARAEAVRQKQKKPRKRSVPPPAAGAAASKSSRPPPKAEATPASREHPTIPPTESKAPVVRSGAQRDLLRMIFIVALVVALGALAIGIMRR
jgi:hypothetical protein